MEAGFLQASKRGGKRKGKKGKKGKRTEAAAPARPPISPADPHPLPSSSGRDAADPADAACARCGRTPELGAKLKTCARCRVTKYCSAECQRLAWPAHKAACTRVLENVQLVLRASEAAGGAEGVPVEDLPRLPEGLVRVPRGQAVFGENLAGRERTEAEAKVVELLRYGFASPPGLRRMEELTPGSASRGLRQGWVRPDDLPWSVRNCFPPGMLEALTATGPDGLSFESRYGLKPGGGTCLRCLKKYKKGGACRVPHALNMRHPAGGSYSAGCVESSFSCQACDGFWTVVRGEDGEVAVEGQRWCFKGKCTNRPLADDDLRRVFPRALELEVDRLSLEEIQAAIDSAPVDTKKLVLMCTVDRCDPSKRIRLNRRFPALEDVQLRDCCFSEVVLNAELTPSVRSLVVENLNDDVARQLACPKMHQMRLLYYGGPRDGPVDFGAVLDEALRTATQLMTFESYKLWSNDELTFASNFLRAIDLKRADSLHELTLWAPRLDQLCLEGTATRLMRSTSRRRTLTRPTRSAIAWTTRSAWAPAGG